MNTKEHVTKKHTTRQPHQVARKFASDKEVHAATDKVMAKYADAIKRLADR